MHPTCSHMEHCLYVVVHNSPCCYIYCLSFPSVLSIVWHFLLLFNVMFSIVFKKSMNVMAIRVQMEGHVLMEWLPSHVLVLTDMKETLVRQVPST